MNLLKKENNFFEAHLILGKLRASQLKFIYGNKSLLLKNRKILYLNNFKPEPKFKLKDNLISIPRNSFDSQNQLFSLKASPFYNHGSFGSLWIRELIRPFLTHYQIYLNEESQKSLKQFLNCLKNSLTNLFYPPQIETTTPFMIKIENYKIYETALDLLGLHLTTELFEFEYRNFLNIKTEFKNLTNIQLFFVKSAQRICSKINSNLKEFYDFSTDHLPSEERLVLFCFFLL